MVEIWRPNESHDKYMYDPAYLENRFGVPPLVELRSAPGVIGVARLVVKPSFSGESIHTLVYRAGEVEIEERSAESSLWYSLNGGDWAAPSASTFTKMLRDLPDPLDRWVSLKEATRSAPTVKVAIIEGREYGTLDGVGYRHYLVDTDTDLLAEWSNPTEMASNHVGQVRLIKAYKQVFQSLGRRED